MTLLENQNLLQVRTWCQSALLSSQADFDWQILCFSHVWSCVSRGWWERGF